MAGGNYGQSGQPNQGATPQPGGYPQQGGYPPQAGQQPGYPQAGGYAKPHRATLVLVLSILSWFVCFICGIVAFFLAKSDLREMKAGLMDRSGEGMTQAAYWLSLVHMILVGAAFVFYLVFFFIMVGVGAAG